MRRVGGVVEQIGEQAEQLRCGRPVDVDVVFDHPHGQSGPAAGQVGRVGPVLGERADAGQPDVGFDADQHVAAGGQHRGDPEHPGEVPVHDPQPVGGEHVGLLAQGPVQQLLFGLGLVPAGRTGHDAQEPRATARPVRTYRSRGRALQRRSPTGCKNSQNSTPTARPSASSASAPERERERERA